MMASDELCDDGSNVGNIGCLTGCSGPAPGYTCSGNNPTTCLLLCGNGVNDSPETCDDSNIIAGDGCSASCTIEPGYQCPGFTSCTPICGDGIVISPEVCDNQNTVSGDGCDSLCSAIEFGYSCSGSP